MNKILSFNRSYFNCAGYLYPCMASTLLVASFYAAFKIGSCFFRKDGNSHPDLNEKITSFPSSELQKNTNSQIMVTFNRCLAAPGIDEEELLAQYHVQSETESSFSTLTQGDLTLLPKFQSNEELLLQNSPAVTIEAVNSPNNEYAPEILEISPSSYKRIILNYLKNKLEMYFAKVFNESAQNDLRFTDIAHLIHQNCVKGWMLLNGRKEQIFPALIHSFLKNQQFKNDKITEILFLIQKGLNPVFNHPVDFITVYINHQNRENSIEPLVDLKVENGIAKLTLTLFFNVSYKYQNQEGTENLKAVIKIPNHQKKETVIKCYLTSPRRATF